MFTTSISKLISTKTTWIKFSWRRTYTATWFSWISLTWTSLLSNPPKYFFILLNVFGITFSNFIRGWLCYLVFLILYLLQWKELYLVLPYLYSFITLLSGLGIAPNPLIVLYLLFVSNLLSERNLYRSFNLFYYRYFKLKLL